jgi:hypothetical protein
MKKYAFVVDVPEVTEDEKAYNHDRPISALLLNQVRHLHVTEQQLPEKDRTGINISTIHTEFQASKYIQAVTKKLHPLKKKTKSKTAKRRPSLKSRKSRLVKPTKRRES